MRLTDLGEEIVHTLDLPCGHRSIDHDRSRLADTDQRIRVSKDRDFLDSFSINGSPSLLLEVAAGNVSNAALLVVLERFPVRVKASDKATLRTPASPRRQSCGYISAVTRYLMGVKCRIGNTKPMKPAQLTLWARHELTTVKQVDRV